VGLNSLKSLSLTNVYPNKNKKNNKVKSKPLELRSRVKKVLAEFYTSLPFSSGIKKRHCAESTQSTERAKNVHF
jgi:hypothetical protein